VGEALRALGAEVVFIGSARAESQLVPQAGFPFHSITVEGLARSNPLRALRAVGLAALAFLRARRLLGRLAPDAVMGAGGYVAGPVALAALTRGVPVLLTEADSRLGLTNRLLAPFARRVCLAFPPPASGRAARRGNFRVTGRPIATVPCDRAAARERLGVGPDEQLVLVFGGSLGARSINEAAVAAFAGSAFRVLHVCGRRDYPDLAGRELRSGYRLVEYMPVGEFACALAAADLVLARAGGSIFEIAAAGVPALLVPYPHATGDHQSGNARWMTDAGAAVTIPDSELTAGRLASQADELLRDADRLARMASASRSLARPRAAVDVARELLEIARA
jgi:UDP-N-acetylglucosamine--N-acetylmuramyl-(pentapeptide) pyrophosphoryl-undecaprenol N-acetylglucosamine transferase